MGISLRRTRALAATAATAAALTGMTALSAPAAAAAEPASASGGRCGNVHSDNGPISGAIHDLETPLGMLGYVIHNYNCIVVMNVEYLLGLNTPPRF